MPFILGNDGKFREIDEDSRVLHDQLPEDLRQQTDVTQIDSIRKTLPKVPGGIADDDIKSQLLNINDPQIQDRLNQMVGFVQERDELIKRAEQMAIDDPTLMTDLPSIVQQDADKKGLLETLLRPVTFINNLQVGLLRGVTNALKDEGTPLEAVMAAIAPNQVFTQDPIATEVQEAVRKNETFGDYLRKDLNLPAGPSTRPHIPVTVGFAPLTPSHISWGIGKAVKEGRSPIEIRPFGPVMTTRGAVGLALDILLDPITWLSLGTNTPLKASIKAFGEGFIVKNPRSVLRFMNKPLLTDQELLRGMASLKATKAGQETLHLLDMFAASQMGQYATKIGKAGASMLEKFSPTFGRSKEVVQEGRRVEFRIAKEQAEANAFVDDLMKGLTKEQKSNMFTKMFNAMKGEAAIKKHLAGLVKAGKITKETALAERLAAAPRITFTDPKMQKAANGLIEATRKYAKASGMPDEVLFNTYIPGILEETLELGIGTKAKFAKFLKMPGRQQKQFIEEGMSKDIEKVFKLRLQQLVNYFHTTRFLKKTIKKFGKKEAEAAALKQGYMEFFPKGNLRFFKQLSKTDKEILAVAKEKPVFLPEKVIKALTDFDAVRTLPDDVNLRFFLRALDATTQQFKGWVTAVWPAFHFRNAFSNRILRYLNEGWKSFKVGDDLDAIRMLGKFKDDTLIELGKGTGKKVPLRTVRKWAERERIMGTGQFSGYDLWHDVARFGDKEISQGLSGFLDPRVSKSNWVKLGRQFGGMIEDEARLASFTRALKDGYTRKEAAQVAFAGLFDYANLSAFERNVMRRLIPFYTFSRKNLSLQVKTALTNPGRQGLILKTFNSLRDEALADMSEEQLQAFNELKPDFLRDSFAIPVGFSPEGDIQWITGFGLPQEEFMELFNAQGLWFRVNPILKFGVEQTLGVDIGRTFGSNRVVGLKENYRFDEFKILAETFLRNKMSDEEFKDWINNPDGFQVFPLTKLLGLKAVLRDVFEAGKRTKKKEISFIANPRATNALRNTFVARGMTAMRQLGDSRTDEVHQLVRFMSGITMFNHNMIQSGQFQAASAKRETANHLRKLSEGYDLKIAVGTTQRAKKFTRKLNKLKP